MRSWRTTLAGVVAGLSMLSGYDSALPQPWPRILHVVSAVALALLGYHAVDCTTCPGNKLRRAAAGLALVACMLLVGCVVSSLRLGVSSPAFGSVQLSIGGGAVGNRPQTPPPETNNAAPVNLETNSALLKGG